MPRDHCHVWRRQSRKDGQIYFLQEIHALRHAAHDRVGHCRNKTYRSDYRCYSGHSSRCCLFPIEIFFVLIKIGRLIFGKNGKTLINI